jgi:hypothetical protein
MKPAEFICKLPEEHDLRLIIFTISKVWLDISNPLDTPKEDHEIILLLMASPHPDRYRDPLLREMDFAVWHFENFTKTTY